MERGAWLRSSHHAGWVAVAVSLLAVSPAAAVDESDLVRRQANQRQARAMAREMVSTVLDLQLRQLEENGLTDLPVYEDIRAMRVNLAGLVESEMAAVVEQLVEAQRVSGAERDAKFVEARRAIRDVVIRLSVERQNLLRRLKAAEIAEQARRVLELQTAARDATAALPSVAEGRRAEAAVRTIEDQQDVKELFLRMAATLAELKTWDGDIATAASEGLRAVTEAGVERRLDDAGLSLESAAFQEATGHQEVVIAELRKLLAVVESAQGAVDDRREELADAIRRLREEQQTLRRQVEAEGLTQPAKPETVETQQAIAEALSAFKEELAEDVAMSPLRDQAEGAAKNATEALFMADEARTLAEQQRVIDRLEALEEALRAGGVEERHDRSAAELAERVRDLEKARDELKQAATKHEEAAAHGAAKPGPADAAEREAAERAAKIEEGKALPRDVGSRLKDAAEAARSAVEALAAAGEESAPAAATEAAEERLAETGEAFERAAASIEEALADAKRGEAAVRIGELARAAEAIERAAAAERELAGAATRAAQSEGLSAEQIAEMKRVQADVAAVAEKAAEGVKAAAPEAAATLGRAFETAEKADVALGKAAEGPGEASKPHAAESGKQAQATAQTLAEAASQLRREIGETANELANEAGAQLAPVAQAQQAVQQAAEALDEGTQQSVDAAEAAVKASAKAETGATAGSQAARRATRGSGTPADAEDALDRAAISLAARDRQLRQDQQFAKQLGQLATRQQSASEAIAAARQALAGAPEDPAAMSPQQRESAKTLHAATRQFAAGQRATGQGAARVSGQRQIANVPLREALQTAERLPVPRLPGDPGAGETGEAAQAGEGTPMPRETTAQQDGQVPSENGTPQAASSGAEGQQTAGSSQNGSSQQATGLGTGLVPAAPDETARMMAGPDAQAALAAMAAAGVESMEDVAASETALDGELPEGTELPEGDDQQAANADAATTEGDPKDSDSQGLDAADRDAAVAPGAAANAPWFAKLPPEVRAAIRASSSRPAPKGYEGRLKRYFESVE